MLMPVYVPTALLAFGQGMLVPTLPFYAKDLGASGSLIGLIVAAAGLGPLATALPAGIGSWRLGRRPAMLMGAGLVAISTIIAGLWANVPGLILLRLLAGAGTALWALSRHAYITDVTQPAQRGRSIAVFGGINRAGSLLAPALGGVLGKLFGLGAPFIVAGILAAGTAGIAFIFVPETGGSSQFKAGHKMRWGLVRGMLRTNWRDISAGGSAQVFAQIIRSGRQLLIPLYGSAIGLDVLTVGGIVSAAAALDVSMFWPAGFLMDRFGRKVAAVPSFLVMALGMLLVARAADYQGLLLAASVIGFG
ncbi:MAG: MFS transporter, partial [Thermomicrobiales bacterium]